MICRHQLAVEIASTKKGSSLVADNIKQRAKTLSAKLVAHEEAHSFYMPDYSVPIEDALAEIEKQPLRLLSSFQPGHCDRHHDRAWMCPPALTEAKTNSHPSGLILTCTLVLTGRVSTRAGHVMGLCACKSISIR
jgi:hypothetical protein